MPTLATVVVETQILTRNSYVTIARWLGQSFFEILVSKWFKRTILPALVAVVVEASDFDKK